jgi:DNA primase
VATCGTAFGPDHAALVRRYLVDDDTFGGEVIYTFDGDAAGQKAALRAFEGDQRFVAQTFIAISPDDMDPCELRLARGDAAVRELVAGRTPLFAFAIRSALTGFDLTTAEGRVGAVRRAAPLVARIRDAALRPEYARLLAGWVGVPEAEVRAAVGAAARAGAPSRGRAGAGPQQPPAAVAPDAADASAPQAPIRAPRPDPRSPALFVERESLKCALQVPELVGDWFASAQAGSFRHPRYEEVRVTIVEAGGVAGRQGGQAWIEAVLAACPDDSVRGLVRELAVEPLITAGEPDARYATSIVARLLSDEAGRRLADLKRELGQLDQVGDAQRAAAVLADVMELEAYRRELARVGQEEA